MIKSEVVKTDRGKVLFLTDGKTEIGCALDFGIRVIYLSAFGMENIFYRQPDDGSDGVITPEGWKLYGGHRIWNTPEDDTCNCPDNDPIEYKLTDNGVVIRQKEEPWRHIQKLLMIEFQDNGFIKVTNAIRNMSDEAMDTAAWGVNTLEGGIVDVDFVKADLESGGYPSRCISLWGDTNIADPRLTWSKSHLTAEWKPIKDYFKLGMYTKSGIAFYRNKGQRFSLGFGSDEFGQYPDNGCNFELFMHECFLEMESLGKVTHVLPGECAEHVEYWKIEKM